MMLIKNLKNSLPNLKIFNLIINSCLKYFFENTAYKKRRLIK